MKRRAFLSLPLIAAVSAIAVPVAVAGRPVHREAQSRWTSLKVLIDRCDVVNVGIDGGGLDELLGLCVIGRDRVSKEWLVWGSAWAHVSMLESRADIAPALRRFVNDGDLTLVEKIGDDVIQAAEIVARIEGAGLLNRIGVDPWGIGAVLDALIEHKIDSSKIIGISQGWKMAFAIKATQARQWHFHGGRAMMVWCVGNARVDLRGNVRMITKQASGTAKIEPLFAMFNAVSLWR